MGKHGDIARKLFLDGYNCSQSVFASFCDITGVEFETAIKISSSFGGGMGRMREVCGTVSGMFMVVGAVYGYSEPKNFKIKSEHYERIQELAKEFKDKNGSIICRELLGIDAKDTSPVPSERTEQYYKKRPCAELVKMAADIMENYIEKYGLE